MQATNKVPGSNPATYNLTGETGSFRYMAPEVALCQPYNQRADVYGFGLLLSYVSTYDYDCAGMICIDEWYHTFQS
jgi:serine/threonine protein kinase